MSRNGSGTYSLPAGNPVVTGTTISTTWANNTLNDIAATLTDSVAADGQTPMTGNLNLSNNKIVNVTDPTLAQDAATKAYTDAKTNGTSAGSFTTLAASSTVSGAGFSTYLASPPAIGGTAAAAGNFTTLGASGVATFSAGTVSAPAITTTGDTNTGIFFPAADTIAFTEGGAEVMRINSSGNVGIGTNNPNFPLDIVASATTGSTCIGISSGNADSQGAQIRMINSYAGAPTPQKSLRVTNQGNFEIVNSAYTNTVLQITDGGSAFNLTGTYGTISDARVKDNVETAREYLSDLCRLRVVKYSLKSEKSEVPTKLGFVAQEVEQVFPNMIESSKDSFSGLDDLKQIKLSVLTPMLVKAIQELKAELDSVKAELATLKA
jgi:hypothetical protein